MANTYSVVNPSHDERIGELNSMGKKTGLLGNTPQTRIPLRRNQQCLFTPYFYEYVNTMAVAWLLLFVKQKIILN